MSARPSSVRAADLLGGEVLDGADHGPGLGHVGVVADLGDAEVGHHHPAVLAAQDVGRLDVAVHQVGPVGGGEGVGHLRADVGHLVGIEDLAAVELGSQVGAVDELHHDGLHAVVVTGVVDGHDAGVAQACGGYRLGAEAGHEAVVGGEVRMQDLDRDPPAEHLVGGLPDLGHAAAGDAALEAVPA